VAPGRCIGSYTQIFFGEDAGRNPAQENSRLGLARHGTLAASPLKHMLHIIWSIIVGAIVGWVAELVIPGQQHLGFWKCALLGIAGSVIGGLIGRLFSKPAPGSSFHPAGFIMSVICAILLLLAWGKMYPA
jgi:uncharacterized membrane protein YeaQ/YmgE (transglycosylase-associated protein family)